MPTTAGQPPGSGANFKALSGKLAARGAHNPGALAAWIGRRKYGRKGFAALSHKHSHEGLDGILLAWSESDHVHTHTHTHADGTTHSHEHSHSHEGHPHDSAIMHGGPGTASGTGLEAGSSLLRTPQPAGLQSKAGFGPGHGVNIRGASGHGLMAGWSQRGLAGKGVQYANTGPAVELATPPMAVTSPWDVLVSRGDSGVVVIRHRRGGQEMGQLRHADNGNWIPVIAGQELAPRTHQRAALADVIGSNNRLASTPLHRPGAPIQPAPTQTPLMAQYGIPAVRALATPATSASAGPRVTSSGLANGDGDADDGMDGKSSAIYKKLRARGFPHERALAFAKRASAMSSRKSAA